MADERRIYIGGGYRPVYMFWHPLSGVYGGLILGAILVTVAHVFGAI